MRLGSTDTGRRRLTLVARAPIPPSDRPGVGTRRPVGTLSVANAELLGRVRHRTTPFRITWDGDAPQIAFLPRDPCPAGSHPLADACAMPVDGRDYFASELLSRVGNPPPASRVDLVLPATSRLDPAPRWRCGLRRGRGHPARSTRVTDRRERGRARRLWGRGRDGRRRCGRKRRADRRLLEPSRRGRPAAGAANHAQRRAAATLGITTDRGLGPGRRTQATSTVIPPPSCWRSKSVPRARDSGWFDESGSAGRLGARVRASGARRASALDMAACWSSPAPRRFACPIRATLRTPLEASLVRAVFDTLYEERGRCAIVPSLAAAPPEVSEDVATIRLRPGIRRHDRRPLARTRRRPGACSRPTAMEQLRGFMASRVETVAST